MLPVTDITKAINTRACERLQEALFQQFDADFFEQMDLLAPEDEEDYNPAFVWLWESVSELPLHDVFITHSVMEDYFASFAVIEPNYHPAEYNETTETLTPEYLTLDVGVVLDQVTYTERAGESGQFALPKHYDTSQDASYITVRLQEEQAANDPFELLESELTLDVYTDLISAWSVELINWVSVDIPAHGFACLALLPKIWAVAVANEFKPSIEMFEIQGDIASVQFFDPESRLRMTVEFNRVHFKTAIDRWSAIVEKGRGNASGHDAGEIQGIPTEHACV